MATPLLPFDVCERRHKGNARSAAANRALHPYKPTARERIVTFVRACQHHGATLLEVAATMDHPTKARKYFPNELSGRFTELRDVELFESGRQRQGAIVWVADRKWINGAS